MFYKPSGPKRRVELNLSEDLVREVEDIVTDVSEAVERSLCALVEQRNSANEHAYYDEIGAVAEKFHQQNGVWGEEYSTL